MGKQHKLDREKRIMNKEESSDEKERKGGSLLMPRFPQCLWIHERCRNDCAKCMIPSGSSEYTILCLWHLRQMKLAVIICPTRTIETS